MLRLGLSIKGLTLFVLANFGVVVVFSLMLKHSTDYGTLERLYDVVDNTISAMTLTFIPYIFFNYLLTRKQRKLEHSKDQDMKLELYPLYGALTAATPIGLIWLYEAITGGYDLSLYKAFIVLGTIFGACAGLGYGMLYKALSSTKKANQNSNTKN